MRMNGAAEQNARMKSMTFFFWHTLTSGDSHYHIYFSYYNGKKMLLLSRWTFGKCEPIPFLSFGDRPFLLTTQEIIASMHY